MTGGEVLTQRALNRALLARQGLLARSADPVVETIERVVGMQAQVPTNPYVGLWARLEGFDPTALSALLERREVVRAQVMRGTIHLLSARDCRAIQPITELVLRNIHRSNFAKRLPGVDVEAVTAAGTALLEAAPSSRAELSEALAPRWPEADAAALGHAVTLHSALVQTTPRGLWGRGGSARFAPTESWLGAPLAPDPSVDDLVLRYLAAFGPATSADVRTWSALTGLRPVIERLRPRLRTFRDEHGRELLDVPGGALPDPATPAPPRFLPEYDNALLSHADRARTMSGHGPGPPFPTGSWIGWLLADGFYRANWRAEEADGVATVTVDRFTRLPGDPPGTVEEILAEGEALLALILPGAPERRVVFDPEP